MSENLSDTRRMGIHTITTRPLNLEEACALYAAEEIPYVNVWREHLEPYGAKKAAKIIKSAGLTCSGLCRGGFFVATGGMAREQARTENRKIIDEAAELGAPVVILVCGAVPGVPLAEARQQILDSIHAIEPHAKACKVKLAIEPLHPMYSDDRSAVNTLDQANNLVMALGSEQVGVAVDVYHLWWDPFLRSELKRSTGTIFSFHVSDWRTPTRDLLNDRGVMGEGCINIPEIREWADGAGYRGPIEVEIFSNEYWAMDQKRFVKRIKHAYLNHV